MKCRVFKKEDGSVVYSYPSQKYQGIENFEGCKFPPETEGLPFVDLDESELHPSNSQTGDYHEMIYFDGECTKENFKQDKTWETCLMPTFLIRQKHHAKLDGKIDAELEKPTPDSVSLIKLQREKEVSKNWTDEEWHAQALKNLDEKVQNGELDKPLIRQKLQEKING